MKIKKVKIPEKSILQSSTYNYSDSYIGNFIDEQNKANPLSITKAFLSTSPKWIHSLLNIRNKIVALFGLKTVNTTLSREKLLVDFKGQVEEQIGLFKVFNHNNNEIILGEDDKHLDFRVSLFLNNLTPPQKTLTISTTVVYHNWFGILYFLPVKPFHKIIVKTILKSIIKEMEKNN